MRYREIPVHDWNFISHQQSAKWAIKFCESTGFDKDFELISSQWCTDFQWAEYGVDYELKFFDNGEYRLTAFGHGDQKLVANYIPVTRPIPQSFYDTIHDLFTTEKDK